MRTILGDEGTSSIFRRRFSTWTMMVLPEPGRNFSFQTLSYSSCVVTVRPRFFTRHSRMEYSVSVRGTVSPAFRTMRVFRSTSRLPKVQTEDAGFPRYSR